MKKRVYDVLSEVADRAKIGDRSGLVLMLGMRHLQPHLTLKQAKVKARADSAKVSETRSFHVRERRGRGQQGHGEHGVGPSIRGAGN
jgi:hypothetical protein